MQKVRKPAKRTQGAEAQHNAWTDGGLPATAAYTLGIGERGS